MKHSLNVIRTGLALVASIALLSACQGGFKSRIFTDKEVAAYKKAQADAAKKAAGDQDTTPAVADTNPKDEPAKNPLQAAVDKAPVKPQEKVTDAAGAQAKYIVEASNREKFITDNRARLTVKDAEVSKLIKGITLTITGDLAAGANAMFGLDGLVAINGEDRFLMIAGVPLLVDKESNITPLALTLTKTLNGEAIADQADVVVRSICLETCAQILTVVTFVQSDLSAVFMSQPVNGNYEVVATNLVDGYKSFADATGQKADGGDSGTQPIGVDKVGDGNPLQNAVDNSPAKPVTPAMDGKVAGNKGDSLSATAAEQKVKAEQDAAATGGSTTLGKTDLGLTQTAPLKNSAGSISATAAEQKAKLAREAAAKSKASANSNYFSDLASAGKVNGLQNAVDRSPVKTNLGVTQTAPLKNSAGSISATAAEQKAKLAREAAAKAKASANSNYFSDLAATGKSNGLQNAVDSAPAKAKAVKKTSAQDIRRGY